MIVIKQKYQTKFQIKEKNQENDREISNEIMTVVVENLCNFNGMQYSRNVLRIVIQ